MWWDCPADSALLRVFGVLCAPRPAKSANSVPKCSCAAAAAVVGLPAAHSEEQIWAQRSMWRIVPLTVLYCMFLASLAPNNSRKWWIHPKNRPHVTSVTHMAAWCGGCRWKTWAGYYLRGLGRAGEGFACKSGGWECLRFQVTVRCISGQWRSLSLALSLSHTHRYLFTHALAHFPIIHPPTHSIFNSFTLFLSLSLSGVLVHARVRVPLSFFLSLLPLHSFSGFLFVSLFFHYTHTRAHAVTRSLSSSYSQTHTRTKSLSPSFLHTDTYFSLVLFFSFSFSLSLTNIHWYTHTHSHSHTLSFIHSLIHSFIVFACAQCVVFSARTRERSLLSVSRPLPPFLVRFLSDSISFVLFPLSRSLASLPSFSHSFASSLFQLLVTMISIWNSPTLNASAFFQSLARGIFSQMERWRRRIEWETNWWESIGISLYSRQDFLTYYNTL